MIKEIISNDHGIAYLFNTPKFGKKQYRKKLDESGRNIEQSR